MVSHVSTVLPEQGELDVSIRPSFVWTRVAGATYEFQIGEDGTFGILLYAATEVNSIHVARETLASNTMYYWRVRAVTGNAKTAWANAFFISTRSLPVQVFVSHTQKDTEFCDIFDRACARVGIKAFRSEFEKIGLPAWQTIRLAIRNSQALFLLVGKELVKAQSLHDSSWEHTQNWIAYETGVACQKGIDVWVICDDTIINFPVPYLNNYLPVSLRQKQSFDYFVSVLRNYAGETATVDKHLTSCPYQNCRAHYYLNVRLAPGSGIVCPQCLRPIAFPQGFPVGQ